MLVVDLSLHLGVREATQIDNRWPPHAHPTFKDESAALEALVRGLKAGLIVRMENRP